MCRNSGAENGKLKEREKRRRFARESQPTEMTEAGTRLFTGLVYLPKLKVVFVDW